MTFNAKFGDKNAKPSELFNVRHVSMKLDYRITIGVRSSSVEQRRIFFTILYARRNVGVKDTKHKCDTDIRPRVV